jgi:hypothetical protein
MLRQFTGIKPPNLTIRVSATMIDGEPPADWYNTSTVHTVRARPEAYSCPASLQDHSCKNCRACWNENVKLVSYLKH